MPGRRSKHVYVVELDPSKVLTNRDFRARNPGYVPGSACLYVGKTGLTPEERFANHLRGHKANKFVRTAGVRLRPDIYAALNPMNEQEALAAEVALALALRARGYAVWQA